MTGRRKQLPVAALQEKYVERFPLAVFFRTLIVVPITLVLLILSSIAIAVAPIQHKVGPAAPLLSKAVLPAYVSELVVVRKECAKLRAQKKNCNDGDDSVVLTGKRNMSLLAKNAGLKKCHAQSITTTSDYLQCQGHAKLGPVSGTIIVVSIFYGLGALVYMATAGHANRKSLPTYAPQLWLSLHVFVAFLASIAFPVASLTLFYHLAATDGPPDTEPRVLGPLSFFLVLASAATALVVADLRTCLADRRYMYGLSTIVSFIISMGVLLSAVALGIAFVGDLGARLLFGILGLGIIAYFGFHTFRESSTRGDLRAVMKYLKRVLHLSPIILVAALTAGLGVATDNASAGGVSFSLATYVLIALNTLFSKIFEATLRE